MIMVDLEAVLAVIESRRDRIVPGLDTELDEIRDAVKLLPTQSLAVVPPSLTPRLDMQQAALAAYSEVRAEREARGVFRMGDHQKALMAAVDAVTALPQWRDE